MAKQNPDSESADRGEASAWNPADAQSWEATPGEHSAAAAHPGTTAEWEAQRQELEQKLQAAEQQALRAQAEFENTRRRLRRDLDEQLKFSTYPLVSDLVEVVDNLTRALASAHQHGADTAEGKRIADGVQMVQSQLNSVLEKHGCRRIVATPGTEFDPTLHSALQMQPHPQIPANHVAAETRVGYRLHDRVVRPAQVIVSTGPGSSTGG